MHTPDGAALRSASSEPELLATPHLFGHPFGGAAAFYPDFGALQLQMMNFQTRGDQKRDEDEYQPLASVPWSIFRWEHKQIFEFCPLRAQKNIWISTEDFNGKH